MKPKWQKLASLAQEICRLWFQFFGAAFASKGYPFKKIYVYCAMYWSVTCDCGVPGQTHLVFFE